MGCQRTRHQADARLSDFTLADFTEDLISMEFETEFRSHQVADSAYLAPNTTVLGDVTVGQESSIWYGSVVRGDSERIIIGDQTNVQDLCVLHADPGEPCRLGDRVTVGHGAIVHAATVEDDVLVGMRAVILNGASIGRGSLIAAGAIVTAGTVVPPGSVVAGTPAVVRGPVQAKHTEMIRHAAEHYVRATRAFGN
jgi:carbonic anhydrase/acetyltransferase-like protein (isoleucine patch superfamily)